MANIGLLVRRWDEVSHPRLYTRPAVAAASDASLAEKGYGGGRKGGGRGRERGGLMPPGGRGMRSGILVAGARTFDAHKTRKLRVISAATTYRNLLYSRASRFFNSISGNALWMTQRVRAGLLPRRYE